MPKLTRNQKLNRGDPVLRWPYAVDNESRAGTSTGGGGTGNVVGPPGAIDGAVARFNGTSGTLIKATGTADFGQYQAINFVIENRTSDPASPVEGQIWLRTDL